MTVGVDKIIKRLIGEDYLGEVPAVVVRRGGKSLDHDGRLHRAADFELSRFNMMSPGIRYEALWLVRGRT